MYAKQLMHEIFSIKYIYILKKIPKRKVIFDIKDVILMVIDSDVNQIWFGHTLNFIRNGILNDCIRF